MRVAHRLSTVNPVRIRTGGESGCVVLRSAVYSCAIWDRGRYIVVGVVPHYHFQYEVRFLSRRRGVVAFGSGMLSSARCCELLYDDSIVHSTAAVSFRAPRRL